MKDRTYTLKGELSEGEDGDNYSALFCGGKVVAKWADELLSQKRQVTIRYWLCPHKMSKEEAQQGFIEELCGLGEGEYHHAYSEITGYLWTDAEFIVGGHNMLQRLSEQEALGKYLILEMVVHADPTSEKQT
jgi:hypothetical protein